MKRNQVKNVIETKKRESIGVVHTHTHTTSLRKEKGITLIALVITIIVLLILAGVTIAALSGDNGILQRASEAKEKTEQAQVEEENTLISYEDYINNTTQDTAVVGEIVTGVNKQYSNNGTAIIPVGFAIVPGFDNVEEGLVISDKANDINDEENQFVWVPVKKFDEFKRQNFGNQSITEDMFDNEATKNKYYEETSNGILDGTEAEKMYKSVKENQGFYIGRYEAGNDGSDNAISKKNVNVYNNIKWANSITDETGGAVEKARNFNIQSGNTTVTSTLVYAVQWDAIMRWLYNGTEKERNLLKDSTGKGNYLDADDTNNPAKTGSNENYKIKNIYDLAGNVEEWTMEGINNHKNA